MSTKKCPVCQIVKSTDEYHKYFSKARNMFRVSNYCKPCGREKLKERAKKYYQENKTERLQFAKEYRAKNKELVNSKRKKYKTKYTAILQDCYAAEICAKMLKVSVKDVRVIPGLGLSCLG